MASPLAKVVETLVLPPNGLFLTALVGFAATALGRRRKAVRVLGRTLVGFAFVGLVALAMPMVAYGLLAPLQTAPALAPDATEIDAQAIVVLAGDVNCDPAEYGPDQPGALSLERCRYGAHLARRTGLPLLITGGVLRPDRRAVALVLADFVEDELGVPVRWTEETATDTRQNAHASAALLRAAGIERAAIVTHAWHMPRALSAFGETDLSVLPAPMGAAAPPATLAQGLVPRLRTYRDSGWAVHEWVGRLWYALTRE